MKKYILCPFMVLLIISTVLWGCGDDSTGPEEEDIPGEGNFTVTVTGDVDHSFSGQAFFSSVTDTDTGEAGFVLSMTANSENTSSGGMAWFVRENSTTPGSGSYTISDYEDSESENRNPEDFVVSPLVIHSETSFYGGSKSGELSISTSSENSLAGTAEFTATAHELEGNEIYTLNVEVVFHAIGGSVSLSSTP